MAAILGVSAEYHDAAAALVVDGRVVAALQEERLSRIKNDPSLPLRAIRECLRIGSIDAAALDAVVFYESPFAKLERVLSSLVRTFPRSWRQFPRALASQLGSRIWVLDRLSETLGVPRERVSFVAHHEAHAASAFLASPFERAAVLTVDGVGEHDSTAIWRGDAGGVTRLAGVEYPHSLGLLYAALTAWLGFEVNEGEYKVMGLAAFGTPRFRDEFAKLVRLHADGSFELGLAYFGDHTGTELGFGPLLEQLLGPRRPPGTPWRLSESEADRRSADVAATLQQVTEEALLGLAREAKRRTGAEALCLAGGVALNAVANARLLAEAGFERVFVQPAAGDAGGALGAALLASLRLEGRRPVPPDTAALGIAIDTEEARTLANSLGLEVTPVDDVGPVVAGLLERGKVVGLARGRSEWGPRALGHRSILAAPRDADVRERLNRVVKRREPFRPFAPAVRTPDAATYFERAPNDLTPWMTTICRVSPSHREALAAVTHVDGTARVQTVEPHRAPELHAILTELGARTGVPVALNTSLNGPGEPIAATATDAIAFLLAHPIDALVVGDLLVRRSTP